jgi:hypothetical protein
MRSQINHVTKPDFLTAFVNAHKASMSEKNIKSGFRATGLVPFKPDCVLSVLDHGLTPTPPSSPEAAWVPKTPQNDKEFQSQSTLVKDKIARHLNSSPTPIFEAVTQILRGTETMMLENVLKERENQELRSMINTLTKRKRRERKYVKLNRPLLSEEAMKLGQEPVEATEVPGTDEDVNGPNAKRRRCRRCNLVGHNSRTCTK